MLFSANYYLHSTDTDFRQGYTVENLIGKESLMAVIIKTPEEIVKIKLSTEDEPMEEVPYIELEKEIVSMIKGN